MACQVQPPEFAESSPVDRGIAHTEAGHEDPTSQLKACASRSLAGHGSTCRSTTLINDLSPSLGLSSSSTTPSTQGSAWSQTTPPSSSHRSHRRGDDNSLGSNDSSIAQLIFSNARANRLSIRRDLEDQSDSSSWSDGSGSSYESSPRRNHGSASNRRHNRVRNADWTQPKPQSSVVVWPSTQRSRSYSTGRIPTGDSLAVAVEGTRFSFGAAAGATDAGAGLFIKGPPPSSCIVDTANHSFRSNSQVARASAKGAFSTSGGIRSRDVHTRVGSVERQLRSSERQPRSSKQTLWRS